MKHLSILFVLPFLLAASCHREPGSATEPDRSIVIVYENDVHCGIDGYAKFAGYRDAIVAADTAWVATVSCGDFLQGGVAGSLSSGQYIVDIMKTVGYDAVTLGNHEFDYGGERMMELLPQTGASILCANFFLYGASQPVYPAYTLKSYGSRKVAFVGVLAPATMLDESYSFYDADGKQLFDLRTDDVVSLVQSAVDEARSKGADYVVLLSHMGEVHPALGISSHELVAATSGIDVVLDGHTHSVIVRDEVADKNGKAVPVTQTGTQFANVGKLVIGVNGSISTTLIPVADIPWENAAVAEATNRVKEQMDQVTARKVATTAFELTINGADGKRLIRKDETNLGDLVTDAFRIVMKAQIGLCNGGGIRASIAAGDITYGNVVDVQPFDNHLAVIEATGAQILSMLRESTKSLPNEEGQFPQVSGLKYTIRQGSHTISDVSVLEDASGQWKPLEEASTYTIALSDYYQGGGFYDTLKDCKLLTLSASLTRDALADYLEKTLGGTVPEIYAQAQGRITVQD